jgi:hypothetical protein
MRHLLKLIVCAVLTVLVLGVWNGQDLPQVDIGGAQITLEGGGLFEYTGADIAPAVTVQLSGAVLDPAGYTVSYENNVYPGTATVTVTGNTAAAQHPGWGSVAYSGAIRAEFTIEKAKVTIHFPTEDPGYIYTGQEQPILWDAYFAAQGESPVFEVFYTRGEEAAAPLEAGEYTASVSLSDEPINENFEIKGANTFNFAIAPAELAVIPMAAEKLMGTQDPSPVAEYTVLGQVGEEMPVFLGELSRRAGEAAGAYGFIKDTLELDPNEPVNANYTWAFDDTASFLIREFTDAPDATLSPSKPQGIDGWYQSEVRILPPEGYSISWRQDFDPFSWQEYLVRGDGVFDPTAYYLRRQEDGAISLAKRAPAISQDSQAPAITGTLQSASGDSPPSFAITATDNMGLDRIVVLSGGKIVRTVSLSDKPAREYAIVYPLTRPGEYTAVAYDVTGRQSVQSASVTVADADGDGLPDDWEAFLGTDPGYSDSDDDGIDDQTALMLGMLPGDYGEFPAGARLLLNMTDGGIKRTVKGVSVGGGELDGLLKSGLASAVDTAPEGDIQKAPAFDDLAVIIDFSLQNGEGWALFGSRLVHFSPVGGVFEADRMILLQGAYGALRLVALPSADGSLMLLAHWNETTMRTTGPLKLLDTRTGKVATLSGSETATCFDLSADGTRAAFRAGGRVHVLDIDSAEEKTYIRDVPVLMFTSDNRLALGIQGESVLFLGDDGEVFSQRYSGPVDTVQRTNTTRSIRYMAKDGQTRVEADGQLSFFGEGTGIQYVSGEEGETPVAEAGEF